MFFLAAYLGVARATVWLLPLLQTTGSKLVLDNAQLDVSFISHASPIYFLFFTHAFFQHSYQQNEGNKNNVYNVQRNWSTLKSIRKQWLCIGIMLAYYDQIWKRYLLSYHIIYLTYTQNCMTRYVRNPFYALLNFCSNSLE